MNHLSAILLDLYFYTVQFARDNDFTKEQTSAFFSIVKKIHEACVGLYEACSLYFAQVIKQAELNVLLDTTSQAVDCITKPTNSQTKRFSRKWQTLLPVPPTELVNWMKRRLGLGPVLSIIWKHGVINKVGSM